MTQEAGEDLEQAADEARDRLLDTVVRLEQRARRAVDVPKQVARSARRFSLPLAGLIAAGVTAIVVGELASRKTRRARDRRQLLQTFWSHPDRELRAGRHSFGLEVLRSLLLTAATSALVIPLQHALRSMDEMATARHATGD